MILPALAMIASSVILPADTVITLGEVERDLTGDGVPEVLRLVGVGDSVDSLAVTFTIESSGELIFQRQLAPLTRTVGFDAGRRVASPSEHRARVEGYGDWFFADEKFFGPDAFLASFSGRMRELVEAAIPEVIARDRRYQLEVDSLVAEGHAPEEAERQVTRRYGELLDTARGAAAWREIQDSAVTIFRFSGGGDSVTAIAWSATDRRFYQLFECC